MKQEFFRLEILRQEANFNNSAKDKIHIYKLCIRSVLEQSNVVWSSAIIQKNNMYLERVQRVAVSLITNSKDTYEEQIEQLNLETLQERRDK